MKNYQCLACLTGLRKVNAPDMEPEFNMAVSRNILILEEIVKAIDKVRDAAREPSAEFKEFSEKRNAINIRFAEKDEKGEPKKIMVPGPGGQALENYAIPSMADPKSPYNVEMEKLREEYKSVIEARDKQIEKFTTFLDQDVKNLNLIKITADMFPKGLSREAADAVVFMLEDEPVKKKK